MRDETVRRGVREREGAGSKPLCRWWHRRGVLEHEEGVNKQTGGEDRRQPGGSAKGLCKCATDIGIEDSEAGLRPGLIIQSTDDPDLALPTMTAGHPDLMGRWPFL